MCFTREFVVPVKASNVSYLTTNYLSQSARNLEEGVQVDVTKAQTRIVSSRARLVPSFLRTPKAL
ncbi:hypothetical protein J6590_071197 [Homalodisca vitripennis]|nr:hypothetical protein J6590_071197 [Homalodisca vitripennis]